MKKILVIDDEELVIKSISRLLDRSGYSVTVARSGKEAIKKAKEDDFDLIVSDVRMPDLNGIETIMQIRDNLKKANKKLVPEILITGYADKDLYEKATELKVADYVYKPFDTTQFLLAVKKTVG